MTMFLVYFVVLLNLNDCLDGPNVCWNNEQSKHYCCSDYEDIQGKCVACTVGFISMSGYPCTPCNSNYYGARCLLQCDCNRLQRCHHSYGCINDSSSNSTVSSADINSTGIIDSAEIDNLHMLAREVIMYFLPVTGILILSGVLCLAYRRRRVGGLLPRASGNYKVRHSFDQSVEEHLLDDILIRQPTSIFADGVTHEIAHDKSKEYRGFPNAQMIDSVTRITDLNEQLDDTTEHQYPSLQTFME